MDIAQLIEKRERVRGVLEVVSRVPVANRDDLAEAYTPGVALLCQAIAADPTLAARITMSGKLVAVISDGTAVLGLGDIGPKAALPIVEGKALLYKTLAGIDALPIVVEKQSISAFVAMIGALQHSFAGIHLEDIAIPRCFAIEATLREQLSIPVYHDDQHGTAIVVLAALLNALRVVKKTLSDVRVVINGAGASGIATAHLLQYAGVGDLILVDKAGIIMPDDRFNTYQQQLATKTNNERRVGGLEEALYDADVFIGLSVGDLDDAIPIASMAQNPIIFALANPRPEITPSKAYAAGAALVATGSSMYPNQVNNVLVFPGFFRGLLQLKRQPDAHMYLRAATALAHMVSQPRVDRIIPDALDKRVVEIVTQAIIN